MAVAPAMAPPEDEEPDMTSASMSSFLGARPVPVTGFFAVAVELGHTASTTQLPATTGYTLSRSSQGVEDSRFRKGEIGPVRGRALDYPADSGPFDGVVTEKGGVGAQGVHRDGRVGPGRRPGSGYRLQGRYGRLEVVEAHPCAVAYAANWVWSDQ